MQIDIPFHILFRIHFFPCLVFYCGWFGYVCEMCLWVVASAALHLIMGNRREFAFENIVSLLLRNEWQYCGGKRWGRKKLFIQIFNVRSMWLGSGTDFMYIHFFPMLFAARCRLLDVVFGRAKFSRAKDSKFYLVSKCNWILFRLSLLVFFCVSINAKQFFVYSSLKECSVQLHRFENSICESVATGGLCAMHRTISFVCQLWLTEIIWVKIFEIL